MYDKRNNRFIVGIGSLVFTVAATGKKIFAVPFKKKRDGSSRVEMYYNGSKDELTFDTKWGDTILVAATIN